MISPFHGNADAGAVQRHELMKSSHMIVEEEDIANSKSVTDTSQMVESKGAETSERDFLRDMEREEQKRRTY